MPWKTTNVYSSKIIQLSDYPCDGDECRTYDLDEFKKNTNNDSWLIINPQYMEVTISENGDIELDLGTRTFSKVEVE